LVDYLHKAKGDVGNHYCFVLAFIYLLFFFPFQRMKKGGSRHAPPGSHIDLRSVSRDERKHNRKEKERVKGKARIDDRRTKEHMMIQHEDEDNGSLADKATDAAAPLVVRLAAAEMDLFREQIRLSACARVTRKDRLLAFAMARHRRLGR
jgi:hypothetical protein